ncbi:hypothetical protein C1752_14789 [Acaryochloris thomasi RCC1774]|uniref:Uncharacterized protein n=1 Tax=Acaryochloris thomasi RCC1774 TaxID=1764569 RepID=A0A2W1JJ46_9CYAN|nr:hypothetical protein [Acaryochloris thomasi]PZD70284.1 hypothetical protein C1752_14789 [Acaryochloris thomasi RCC1774]
MFSKNIPALVVAGAATSIALSAALPAQATQRLTLSQAAEKAKVHLNPSEGVYIQLPASMPIYTYSIDDGSVLTLGDKFSPGMNILRIVGQNPGKTGMGLVVQGSSGYQTLNFSVHVGKKGSQGTIQITEDAPQVEAESARKATDAALQTSNYPSDLVRSGLSLANIQGQIPAGSPLDIAVNQWIDAVEQGASEGDASRQTGVQSNVLQKLTDLGQTTPIAQAPTPEAAPPETAATPVAEAPPEATVTPVSEVAKTPALELDEKLKAVRERIAALEEQVESNTNELSEQEQILAQVEAQQQTFLARFDDIDAQSKQFLAELGDIKETDIASVESPQPQVDQEVAAAPEPQPQTVTETEATPESGAETQTTVVITPEEQPPQAIEDSVEVKDSLGELTPIELAHAIKQGLHQNTEDYPYRSWKYRQVNNAVLILKRGNSIETASKWSGIELKALRKLAGVMPLQVSQGVVQ